MYSVCVYMSMSVFYMTNMAPKNNAFNVFIAQYKNDEIKKGIKTSSFQQLATKLTPVWDSLSEDEKKKYKIIANELNSIRKDECKLPAQIHNLHINSSYYWKMIKCLKNMFENIKDEQQLLEQKFILLHVNCHSHIGEQYYFPAEIAMLEFNLSEGISRTFHKIIGISKTYPRGFAGSMREYSEKFHEISCWHEHPDDYENILLDLFKFLEVEIKDYKDLTEHTLNLPNLYTIESDICLDMMKTKSSLQRLYKTVFPNHNFEHSDIFKVASIERLLTEIKIKLNLHLDSRNVKEGMAAHEILQYDMYGSGLGCDYHEGRDIAFKCSRARIFQWMSNICLHINKFNGLKIIPGKHIAVQLRDGSRMILENGRIPFAKQELIVGENKSNKNYSWNKFMIYEQSDNIILGCLTDVLNKEKKSDD